MSEFQDDYTKAIGNSTPKDWELRPREHAGGMNAAAGPVIRILERDELDEIIEKYEVADAAAKQEQAWYKAISRVAAIASFLAVIVASLFLLAHTLGLQYVSVAMGGTIQLVLLVLSLGCSLWVSQGQIYHKWMHKRAEAEDARVNLFDTVYNTKVDANKGELAPLPLKLEYFIRFQLKVQTLYYRDRGREHREAVRRMTLFRIVALFFIFLAFIPAGMEHVDIGWKFTDLFTDKNGKDAVQQSFIFFGLLGSGLQGLLATLGLISQHERNAARFEDTFNNLEMIRDKTITDARDAARSGDSEGVAAFINTVQDYISSEHREWLVLSKVSPDLTLDKLKELSGTG